MSTKKNDSPHSYTPKKTVRNEFLKGAFAGAVEVFVDHPLWVLQTEAIKRAHQKNLNHEKLNWRGLYRGVVPNAVSMVGITALQMGFRGFFQNHLASNDPNLADFKKSVASFMGGFVASGIAGPTECVMTAQNVTKNSRFVDAAVTLAKQHGMKKVLTQGTLATGIRDGVFTLGYTEAKKSLQKKISPQNPDRRDVALAAGATSGTAAAIISHPVNVVKVVQHLGLANNQSLNVLQAANSVWKDQGAYGFFKGLLPRGIRVVSAICLIGSAMDECEKFYKK